MLDIDEGADLPRGRWLIPEAAAAYKRTPTFDGAGVPAALLRAHDTKAGVWGELVILAGSLLFVDLGDEQPRSERLGLGRHGLIQPERLHRVELAEDTRFFVVFWA
ncbi:MAG: DUF1971 domain-containing protein [Myxococcales bacterium]|nr:DUF1971 domain-containing protein [Myxococcales bacterium]